MDPKYYGLVEMVVSFGVVAAFTIQQLWSLRDKPEPKQPGDDTIQPDNPPEALRRHPGLDPGPIAHPPTQEMGPGSSPG